MYDNSPFSQDRPVRVGLVGTGAAAKLRAEAFVQDKRSHLVAIAGNTPEKTEAFAKSYETEMVNSWEHLVEREDVDLVVVCTVNRDHGAVVHKALKNSKHVVVEYPLSLDVAEAEELIALSKRQNRLLHIEHIEILGGVHQALKQHLPQVGQPFFARYNTIKPEHPAPRKWTYNHELFGFPLIGALSRLHRLVDLFGDVMSVNCHNRFWTVQTDYYQSCFCEAVLSFNSGLLAHVIYGKGETLWHPERKFEVHGENGGLIFNDDTAILIQAGERKPIEVGTRRGLFAKDTTMVLDCLIHGTPLYITPEQSLYTLKVADAARRSAEEGITAICNPRAETL
ncbi:Gfo/Idh/MocA family oxidoreductase [Scytonema sp. NUACC21]